MEFCIFCFCIFFFFKQKTAYEMLRSLVGSEMCIRDSSYLEMSCLRCCPCSSIATRCSTAATTTSLLSTSGVVIGTSQSQLPRNTTVSASTTTTTTTMLSSCNMMAPLSSSIRRVNHHTNSNNHYSGSISCATSSTIQGQTRANHGSQPSAVRGIITPFRGFVTTDIRIDNNTHIGGQYSRGVFATANIGYGREVMNIKPIASYVGDEPIRDQAMIIATDLFATLVNHEKSPASEAFILSRVMSMMNGGRTFFLRERDVTTFIDRVPGGSRYMEMGKVTVMQLQKLPQQIEFNRWEVEYRGRKGICVFPEASYFNHQCSPNVGITIMHDSICLLYTSDAADEEDSVDLGGRRIIKKKKNTRRDTIDKK
eukprot:TRINITY_DN9042_c0_g1_i3.p1 TRINITY_DN9042_c0_g1~~TRINITY_DN9042_c0_g1_i3.p1  ORF type:complete len:368 (+),score=69.64 TRINITY_DN9042_c0_g1_i3:56-1159(+)